MNDSNSTVMKHCKNCQCETERNTYGQCKPCSNIRSRAWKLANMDRNNIVRSEWAKRNSVKVSSYSEYSSSYAKAYYEKNKEKLRRLRAEYRKNNPDKVKASEEKWKRENPGATKVRCAEWNKANRERVRVHSENRRARKLKVGGELSKDLAFTLLKLQRGKCACCKKPLGDKYHLDHIMPLFLGGANTDDNIQLLHPACNSQKRAKHPVDFMQEKGYLI